MKNLAVSCLTLACLGILAALVVDLCIRGIPVFLLKPAWSPILEVVSSALLGALAAILGNGLGTLASKVAERDDQHAA